MIINNHCRHRDHQGRSYSQVGTTNNVPCTITLATQELIPIFNKAIHLVVAIRLVVSLAMALFISIHKVVVQKIRLIPVVWHPLGMG